MLRRFAAAMALWFVPAISVAQVIPPGAQPGRERERFIEPRPPQVQPGASVISLPSTVAPPCAEPVKLIIPPVQIRCSTIYSEGDLKPV